MPQILSNISVRCAHIELRFRDLAVVDMIEESILQNIHLLMLGSFNIKAPPELEILSSMTTKRINLLHHWLHGRGKSPLAWLLPFIKEKFMKVRSIDFLNQTVI